MKNTESPNTVPTSPFQNILFGSFEQGPVTHMKLQSEYGKVCDSSLPEILFITSFPPRECGIATYSQDLINSLTASFQRSFNVVVCALETNEEKYMYKQGVSMVLNTSLPAEYLAIAEKINRNKRIEAIVIQHEFGFFRSSDGHDFLVFLHRLNKPIILVFHTVLPKPDINLSEQVKSMVSASESVIVMTENSRQILKEKYGVPARKIEVIPHGTHLVTNNNKTFLKEKYGLCGRKVLATFGLLSSGKSFETSLDALPEIISRHRDVIFLAIGKTHPGVIQSEGERYRRMLEAKVKELHLEDHVRFINQYLDLPELLEYLRLTDIYLFTSRDPNQAVSGTFSYAMSCGCPIISTPIPQAREMLDENTGIIIDFQDSAQLAKGVLRLLSDEPLRKNMSNNTLHKIAPTAWENSAIAHALLFEKTMGKNFSLKYSLPDINLNHIRLLTTDFGMVQFSKINHPDIQSGYTIDDNARAMIAVLMHYQKSGDTEDLSLIYKYLDFISYCMQPDGTFLNYLNENKEFTLQNAESNLEDANGRAIWALGFLLSIDELIPDDMKDLAERLMAKAVPRIDNMHSSRAMAFCIKGLYYHNKIENLGIIKTLADRLAAMYEHEAGKEWKWFESYLTYANSILPEAMLLAWLSLKEPQYFKIASDSFRFLLEQTFSEGKINVISNNGWLSKGGERNKFGEQPIDVSYTVLALDTFYRALGNDDHRKKLKEAFNWFNGNNHLQHIIYNPCTGGCYDGLEESQVNLNQGAESAVSYLMARLVADSYYWNKSVYNKSFSRKTVLAD
jgi:glycosyltransferase involved in cell wall biosynthesis